MAWQGNKRGFLSQSAHIEKMYFTAKHVKTMDASNGDALIATPYQIIVK
jgi:hypothetical protein